MKSHMKSPVSSSNRTRCGKLRGDIGNFYPIVHKYGSPDATCKTCQRLYAQDLKIIVNCNGCRDAPMDIHDIEKACDVCTEDELDIMNNGGDDQ